MFLGFLISSWEEIRVPSHPQKALPPLLISPSPFAWAECSIGTSFRSTDTRISASFEAVCFLPGDNSPSLIPVA